MKIAHSKPRSRVILWLFVVVLIASALYSVVALRDAGLSYQAVGETLSREKTPTVSIDEHVLGIPSYELFQSGALWSLIGPSRPLPQLLRLDLVPIPVAHGDASKSMRVSRVIAEPLKELFAAAKADGTPLMVSSAYRSSQAQQKLYDFYLTERGQAYTISHVAKPNESEHQSGLAVDINSASLQCAADSDQCELGYTAIAWLATNAPDYGFIQRYPMGKQSITGYANEEWHYRYVGIPLAKLLSESDLTLDEFVAQAAPGYSK